MPGTLPIGELVDDQVELALRRVTEQNGCSATLLVEWALPDGGNDAADWKAVIHEADDEEDPEQPDGYSAWIRPMGAQIYVPRSESNEIRYTRKLNVIRAEVERELQRDPQLGNTCQNLICRAPAAFGDGNSLTGILVQFDVYYRHFLDDPFAK